MAINWRDATKGHTRRMVERAAFAVAMYGVTRISPLPPPKPAPSLLDLAKKQEAEEEERQRDIFFNKMDWITSDFARTFWAINAKELIENPSQAGFAYDTGSFPYGGEITIGTKVVLDSKHIDESYQIARIDLARKLLNSGGTHGANYRCGGEMLGGLNALWMSAVPVFLDHGG